MKFSNILFLFFFISALNAQTSSLQGQLQDANGGAVNFANIVLFNAADSSVAKVETSDDTGVFRLRGLAAGQYFMEATFVGLPELRRNAIVLGSEQALDLGVLTFAPTTIELAETTITGKRALVEIKPDRMVFNVQGTINSIGSDAVELLRKAPGVSVDNNENISLLGRSGVIVYVDGKRLPLGGQELAAYLKSLVADQIDRIDIITSPGAKYEAEGNAGIIDIRLKKDQNLGANGSVNLTGSQGRYAMGNATMSGNYRNKALNLFGSVGAGSGERFMDMDFFSLQNNLVLDEINRMNTTYDNFNWRAGTDFFLKDNHTLGFLVSGMESSGDNSSYNRLSIAPQNAPGLIDSILIARNSANEVRSQYAYNLNYRFENKKGNSLNLDLDYGNYDTESDRYQPNIYYDAEEKNVLSQNIDSYKTNTGIDIYTFKVDYEQDLLGGKLGVGSKLSRVDSDNLFLFFDEPNGAPIQNDTFSNRFDYVENVYAGYLNFVRQLGEKWNLSAGLRAEQTDATGDLQAFLPALAELPLELNYLSLFPSAGLTWQALQQHSFSLNYGRRINRPDYNVLNPFNNRLSELSYEKGNPRLNPEIVNNVEAGWTYAYRYNFQVGYSRTIDQITRLIAPDTGDVRSSFITWANLAHQTVWSINASLPFEVRKGWNAYFNLGASHINNQATYPEGGVVDVQAFTYNIYTQQTFDLPLGLQGEVSGWFGGPGVWGGVFLYETSWSLNLGLQRKFLQEKLNVRLSANDLFFQSGWDGYSKFNGLYSEGGGRFDSRRVSLSVGYGFGNQNVKSRKRETGLKEEAGRVGGE